MAEPTVSIVIRTLNEAAHIGRLLSGLGSQTQPADEIIVVDSGSTDGTVDIAERFGCRIVHMPPTSFTFGRSLNWGCEAAKGDVLVFVSAHVYPLHPNWLALLTEPFDDPEVALTYGGQTGDHRSNFAELRLLARWFPEEPNADQKDPFCNNANCAIRRERWEEHPYDESLPGLEDLAFAQHLLDSGYRLAYVSDARIAHVHEESFAQTLNRYRREAMAYKHIFGRTEITLGKAITLATASISGDGLAALRQGRLRELPSAVGFRVAQFTGAYLGNRTDSAEMRNVVRRMYYPGR